MAQASNLAQKVQQKAGQPPKTAAGSLTEYVKKNAKNLLAMIPKAGINDERLLHLALIQTKSTPKLMECTMESLVGGIMQSLKLGLELGGVTGEAHLVPYKNYKNGNRMEAQFQIGYKGMEKLAYRSGDIANIYVEPVYANDVFAYVSGLHRDIKHEPVITGDKGEFIGCYAVAIFKSEPGTTVWQQDYMPKKDIDAIRARSKAKDNGPWVSDYVEMARKTVIKRISKHLPLSTNDMAIGAGSDEHVINTWETDDGQAVELIAAYPEDDATDQAEETGQTEQAEPAQEPQANEPLSPTDELRVSVAEKLSMLFANPAGRKAVVMTTLGRENADKGVSDMSHDELLLMAEALAKTAAKKAEPTTGVLVE